jgi:hypothetical protein
MINRNIAKRFSSVQTFIEFIPCNQTAGKPIIGSVQAADIGSHEVHNSTMVDLARGKMAPK